jgi:hypothetical protein
MRLVAMSVSTRGAVEDLRAVAEPSPDLTAVIDKYDRHEAALASLLQAEWQYHRGGPWDERALLYKLKWDLSNLLVHHAPWQKRPEVPDCPTPVAVPSLSDATTRLRDRMDSQNTLAQAITEQFEGYDIKDQRAEPGSDASVVQVLALVLGGLALLSGVTVFFTWRRRSWQPIDGLVAFGAIVLVNLAGWLALGAGADQERLRAALFAQSAAVFQGTLDLNHSVTTLKLAPRGGVLQPRDSGETILADYRDYWNSLRGLEQLVRVWDRAVLTGPLDASLVSPERIETHDDLLNVIRARTLTLYRQYAQLDRRLSDLRCPSDWFERDPSTSREDRFVALP